MEKRLDTLQRVELADGVEVRLRIAGPYARAWAWALDLLIKIVLLISGLFLFGMMSSYADKNLLFGVYLIYVFAVNYFYNIFMEASSRGATIGKKIMKLRVVTLSGGRITSSQAVIRNFARMADMLPLYQFVPSFALGVLVLLFSKRFQRIGDMMAKTLVVYDERYRTRTEGKLIEGDVLRPRLVLTREEQAIVGEYLERAHTWSMERRVELADLLTELTGASGGEGEKRLMAISRWIKEGRR